MQKKPGDFAPGDLKSYLSFAFANEKSAANDVVGDNPVSSIAGVEHKLRALHDVFVVVSGVVGDDQHAIEALKLRDRSARHVQVVLATAPHLREERIVVTDLGSLVLQEL